MDIKAVSSRHKLKKFIQLWTEEKIEEKNLVRLGLLT